MEETMIVTGDLVLPNDKICPDVEKCQWRTKATAEEIKKNRHLRCPHEYPHNRSDCGKSKCCPRCVEFDSSTITLSETNRVI
jgi:hypothetical protein